MKGLYHKIREAWKKPDKATLRERMVEWRKSEAITQVDKPLRLDRARALGYKAKKGVSVVRVRLKRGGHKRPRPIRGRRTKRMSIRKTLKMSYKWIAESRAERKYKNLVALNSYMIGKDGIHYFYEVIMIDPSKPEIKNDRTLNFVTKGENKKRALRGLTSAAKKSRGLRAPSGRTPKITSGVRAGGRKGK